MFCIFCRFYCLLTIKIFFPKKSIVTTQIVYSLRGRHTFAKQSYKVCIAHCCSCIARQSILNCK